MTFNDIFKSSFLESVSSFSVADTIIGLLFSLVVGLFIFVIYKKTLTGVMYSTGFALTLAVIGSVIIGCVLLVLANRKSHDKPYMLVIRCTDPASEAAAMAVADKLHDKPRVKAKTVTKDGVEITAEVRLRDGSTDFVGEISALDGVESAALVSYNGEYMG